MGSFGIRGTSLDPDLWYVDDRSQRIDQITKHVATAINSLAFQARAGLLRYLSLDKIRCASDNWKRIWDSVIGLLNKDQFLHLGYPKHAQELWWLLNATLDASSRDDVSLSYMDNTATDDLGNLNEFIQWCHQSAP